MGNENGRGVSIDRHNFFLPRDPEAGRYRVAVSAGADFAVVAKVERRAVGNRRAGRESQDGAVALR